MIIWLSSENKNVCPTVKFRNETHTPLLGSIIREPLRAHKNNRPRVKTRLIMDPALANGDGADSWQSRWPKKQERSPGKFTQVWLNLLYVKPWGAYPVFLFLFKFFFEFPNFPLKALDVLGELGNGLWLLAITTTAPGRTAGPAGLQRGRKH